jgi:hypothetical protein
MERGRVENRCGWPLEESGARVGSVILVLPADGHVMGQAILADGGMVRML